MEELANHPTIPRRYICLINFISNSLVGEPPLFMGSVVFFAIRDAINAARRDAGVEEVLELHSPATPERIRLGCEDEIVRRCIVKPKEGEKSFFVVI